MAKLSSCKMLPSLKPTVRTLKFDGWNVPIFRGKLLGSGRILIMMIALLIHFSPRLRLGSIKGMSYNKLIFPTEIILLKANYQFLSAQRST